MRSFSVQFLSLHLRLLDSYRCYPFTIITIFILYGEIYADERFFAAPPRKMRDKIVHRVNIYRRSRQIRERLSSNWMMFVFSLRSISIVDVCEFSPSSIFRAAFFSGHSRIDVLMSPSIGYALFNCLCFLSSLETFLMGLSSKIDSSMIESFVWPREQTDPVLIKERSSSLSKDFSTVNGTLVKLDNDRKRDWARDLLLFPSWP